jgi:putative nucleotidyltransferase with HDIG domain
MDALTLSYLARLASLTDQPLYLVGGPVRDLLRGDGGIKDLDLLMPAGSEDVARRFADVVGGSFFFLDEERKITRVVKNADDGVLQFDFTNFEGPDLRADLARRDFTVNAMALDLRAFLAGGALDGIVDPFGGREDVRQRIIRAADPKVLDDDPLRLLRAVRFAATLGYSIEGRTAAEITKRADLIAGPSPERVRDELFLILAENGAGAHLMLLESLGLLGRLLPELLPLRGFAPGRHHRHDILTHAIRTADYVDAVQDELRRLAPHHDEALREHLAEPLEHLISRKAALRFACLLHDIAKAETYSRDEEGDVHFYGHDQQGADRAAVICRRLRLSRSTEAVVERLVRHHMRTLALSAPNGPSRRALYRYCRDLKDALPESIVLSLADAQATSEVMPGEGFTDTRQTAVLILDYYYGRFLKVEAKPFITGDDLIARGMQPGPRFREILEAVRAKQAEGALRDRDEALASLDAMDAAGR